MVALLRRVKIGCFQPDIFPVNLSNEVPVSSKVNGKKSKFYSRITVPLTIIILGNIFLLMGLLQIIHNNYLLVIILFH